VNFFRPSLSFLAEAQPRLLTGEVTLHFLHDRTNYKAKDIIGKITNLLCIYLFQIDKFINMYIHIDNFFIVFVISLPTKLEIYYIFAIQLIIYINYGDGQLSVLLVSLLTC
jgi:hypothetical protein